MAAQFHHRGHPPLRYLPLPAKRLHDERGLESHLLPHLRPHVAATTHRTGIRNRRVIHGKRKIENCTNQQPYHIRHLRHHRHRLCRVSLHEGQIEHGGTLAGTHGSFQCLRNVSRCHLPLAWIGRNSQGTLAIEEV